MEKKSHWPLLVFATSATAVSRRIQQARRAGELRELLPRVYTSDLTTDLTICTSYSRTRQFSANGTPRCLNFYKQLEIA